VLSNKILFDEKEYDKFFKPRSISWEAIMKLHNLDKVLQRFQLKQEFTVSQEFVEDLQLDFYIQNYKAVFFWHPLVTDPLFEKQVHFVVSERDRFWVGTEKSRPDCAVYTL